MTDKPFYENRFNSIQVLRGIAALFVILEHVRFLSCGAFGVDIFFCISGFMIMFTTHKSTKYFLRKRLIRIVPLYYLMTLGTYLLLLLFPAMFQQTAADPIYLVKSLLFIPFDIGGGILQPLMRIGWTVNCEMFFYLLFFLSFCLSHRYRGLLCSLFLSIVVVLSHILPLDFAPLTFYGNPVMLEFVLGIISYYILRSIYQLHSGHPFPTCTGWLTAAGCIGIFTLLVITKPHINVLGFNRLLLWGIPAFVLVICAFVMGLTLTQPSCLVKLGDMSYSLYLMHYYPVMLLDRTVFDFSSCTPLAVAGVVLSILLSIALAYISWLVVEKRFTGWLCQKTLQKNTLQKNRI